MNVDRVIIGDCREALRTLPESSVQCVVTSANPAKTLVFLKHPHGQAGARVRRTWATNISLARSCSPTITTEAINGTSTRTGRHGNRDRRQRT